MTQIWRVTVSFLFDGSIEMENVHHYSISPDPDSPALTNLCVQLCTDWETYLESNMSDSLEYRGNWLRRVDVASQPAYWFPFSGIGDGIGDLAAQALNPREALVVNWYAFAAYPRLGRTYIPGWTENSNDSTGVPTTGAISAAEAYAAGIRTESLVGGSVATKVAVRYSGTPPYVSASNALTTYQASVRWGNLRSRKS